MRLLRKMPTQVTIGLALIAMMLMASGNLFAAVIYQDGFETADGYTVSTTENISIIGQQGWTEGAYGATTTAAFAFANGMSPYGDTLMRISTSSAGTSAAAYKSMLDTPITSGVVEIFMNAKKSNAYVDIFFGSGAADASSDSPLADSAITFGFNATAGARSYFGVGRGDSATIPAGWYTFHGLLDIDNQMCSVEVLNADGSAVAVAYDGWSIATTPHTYPGIGTFPASSFAFGINELQNFGFRSPGMSTQTVDFDNVSVSTISPEGVATPQYVDSFEVADGYNASPTETVSALGQQGWTAGTYGGEATQLDIPADGTSPYGESMLSVSNTNGGSHTAVYKSFTDTPITSGIVEVTLNVKAANGIFTDVFFGDSTAISIEEDALVGAAATCGFNGIAGARVYTNLETDPVDARANTAAIDAGWYTYHLLIDMDSQVYSAQLLNEDGSEVVFDYDGWDVTGIDHTYGDLGTFNAFEFKNDVTELQNVGVRNIFQTTADLGVDNITISTIESTPQVAGDANGDGKVDGSDVTILAGNWQAGVDGTVEATWEMGDFNGDKKVDGSDVTILAGNWQYGVTAAAASVPEPGTIALLLTAIGSLLVWRRFR